MNARSSTPDTICLQCGDRGFTNAFVFCVKCLTVAVHRYCLNVIPEAVDEFVHWVCDDCEVKVQNQPAVHKHDASRCQTKDPTASEHITGSTTRETKKNDIVAVKNSSKRPHEQCTSAEISKCAKLVRISKKKKTVMSSEANFEDRRNETLFTQHVEENKLLDLDVSNFSKEFSKDSNISSIDDCQMRSEPVITPIWRGSFIIKNKNDDIFDGLVAHMCNRACQKVYEQTSRFQPVLHLEMLPSSDIWPKSFEKSEPSENIALYFFPSDIRSERVFDHLVDTMVHEELAMRADMQNAELLVFSSTKLPLLHWRFQGKYYLWGVFREKQHQTLCSQSCKGESNYNQLMITDRPNDTGISVSGERPSTCSSLAKVSDENRLKGPNDVDSERNLVAVENLIHVPKDVMACLEEMFRQQNCYTTQNATKGFKSPNMVQGTRTQEMHNETKINAVSNIYMNNLVVARLDLRNMLQKPEELIKKEDKPVIMVSDVGQTQKFDSFKGTRNFGNKKKRKLVGFRKQVKKGKDKSEDCCHHCGKKGHWKRNCYEYLASLKKDKVSQG